MAENKGLALNDINIWDSGEPCNYGTVEFALFLCEWPLLAQTDGSLYSTVSQHVRCHGYSNKY